MFDRSIPSQTPPSKFRKPLLGINKRTGQTAEKWHFETVQGVSCVLGHGQRCALSEKKTAASGRSMGRGGETHTILIGVHGKESDKTDINNKEGPGYECGPGEY